MAMGKKSEKMGKAIKRLKKKASNAQKKIDAPSSYVGMNRRKSTKEDRTIAEGGIAEGTRGLSVPEKIADRKMKDEKYRRLSKGGTFTKRNRAKAKIKELEAKKNK